MTIQQSEPVATITFEITFDGAGITSGTFSDDRGNHGSWTAENGVITIIYSDWNFVVLEGAVYDMSGIFKVGEDIKGGWGAERLSL